jgi:hypothetical protein
VAITRVRSILTLVWSCFALGCVQITDLDDMVFAAGPGGDAAASSASGVGTTGVGGATSGPGTGGGAASGGAASAGGGAAGQGGGGSGDCQTVLLSDHFDDGVIGSEWSDYTTNGTITLVEQGGAIVITAASGSTAGASLTTVDDYDFTSGELSVELVEAIASGSDGHMSFSLSQQDVGYVAVRKEGADIKVVTDLPSYTVMHEEAYSPTAHRYVRFRREGGVTHAEASADAADWMAMFSWQQDDYFPPGAVRVTLVAIAAGDGFTARFDNVLMCR